MNACAQCGAEHPRCAGHNRTGGPCGRPPIRGGNRCPKHGGALPSARLKAAETLEDREVRRILADELENPEPIEHPVYELLKLAAEVKAGQRAVRRRMVELSELTQEDKLGVERERALVGIYERYLDRNAKLLVDMAKLDLKARALALQAETAREVLAAVSEALRRTGLAAHDEEVRAELASVLRSMTIQPEALTPAR